MVAVDLEISHLAAGERLPGQLVPRYPSLKILDLVSCGPTTLGRELVDALLHLPSLEALLNINTLDFMRRLRRRSSPSDLVQRASLASRLTSLSFGPLLDPAHRNVTKDLAAVVDEWGSLRTLRVPYRLSRTQDLEALIRPLQSSLQCVDVETCCGCRQVVKALEGLDLRELLITDIASPYEPWGEVYLDYSDLAKMSNLQRLSLRCLQVTDRGIAHLSVLTQLTRLDLCSPRVTGTAMLHACRPLTRIQFLDFGSCYHDSVEFQQMLLTFPRLRDLDYVDPRSLSSDMRLGKCNPGITSLRAIYCSHVAELRDMGPLTSLIKLELECCGHNNGIHELAACTRLTFLSLPNRCGSLHDADLAHIAPLTGLRFLSLAGNNALTGAGVARLAGLPLLCLLDLSYLDPCILSALESLQVLPLQWMCLSGLGVLTPGAKPSAVWVTDREVEAALPDRAPVPLGIDHLGIYVENFEDAERMYLAALKPLDYSLQKDLRPKFPAIGLGTQSDIVPSFWVAQNFPGKAITAGIHLCFRAKDEEAVQEFHRVALAEGFKCNGPPGPRSQYGPDYYAAFALDAAGNNIEAVVRG